MSSPFEQLFDISPFPAVISRLNDNTVIAINKRNSEMFGVSHADAVGQLTTNYYANVAHRERLREPLEKTGRADDVVLHLKKPNGDTFWARASARLITWDNEPAVLTVFEDISEQLNAQLTLQASERRLAAQSQALTSLTASHADPNDTFEQRLRRILEMAADTLGVERVSMWRFDVRRAGIECVGLFKSTERAHESGAQLTREAAPAYFDAIERERVIAAPDARTDPRTERLSDVVSRAAQHLGDAGRAAAARRRGHRRVLRRTRRRPARVDGRRTELRRLDREPHRRRDSPMNDAAKRSARSRRATRAPT